MSDGTSTTTTTDGTDTGKQEPNGTSTTGTATKDGTQKPDQGQQRTTTDGSDGAPGDDATLEEWKAHARKWERQSKANSTAAEELQKIKDAELTEAQREKKRADQLDADLKAERVKNLRTEVAIEKGLPVAMASRLTGNTREDLEQDANDLLALIGGSTKTKSPDPALGKGNGQGGSSSGGDWLREQLQSR